MAHRGRSITFTTMAAQSPLPPLAGIAGGGVVAQLRGGRRVMESDPNYVPCARRGTMAVANTVAFFGWMDAFVPW